MARAMRKHFLEYTNIEGFLLTFANEKKISMKWNKILSASLITGEIAINQIEHLIKFRSLNGVAIAAFSHMKLKIVEFTGGARRRSRQ